MTAWVCLLFGISITAVTAYIAWRQEAEQFNAFLAALAGAAVGWLYAALDHDEMTIKSRAMITSDLTQYAYISLRVSIPTALGFGGSYILFGDHTTGSMKQYALAFIAAYIADASKLIVSR